METNGSVTFRVPDFVGDDGTVYSDIEITIVSEIIHDAAQLAKTLERPSGEVEDGR